MTVQEFAAYFLTTKGTEILHKAHRGWRKCKLVMPGPDLASRCEMRKSDGTLCQCTGRTYGALFDLVKTYYKQVVPKGLENS